MGLGFILGGYCPGTSVCAAAIGKKDAITFVVGGFLGVLLYGEAYPLFAGWVNGGGRGPLKVYDSLGVSRGGFALFLIVAAIVAFAVTSWIEKRVSAEAPSRTFRVRPHYVAGSAALAIGIVLFGLPDRKARLLAQVGDSAYRAAHPVRLMTADELAYRILDDDPRLIVIDLRSVEARKDLAVPGSLSIPIDGLFAKEWTRVLGRRRSTRVFVDEDGGEAVRAALLAERLGYDNVRALEGGLAALRHTILEYQSSGEPANAAEADAARFRAEARRRLARRIADAKAQPPPPKTPIRKAPGGC
jgi:rhodanese-related sulfurtransferase